MSETKPQLRELMQKKRTALPAEARLRVAEEAARQALPLFDSKSGAVALYWPMRHEISPLILAEHLHQKKYELCLPIAPEKNAPLQFRHWAPEDQLHKGRYGINEPLQKSPLVMPAVLLVPLLAFDKTGARLGMGAGYYDRTLKSLRLTSSIKAYGFAYSFQEVDSLPQELHDERLDAVITEKAIVMAR
jgi:5-formyltetrahydrofolate cyclo-ligase